MFVQCPHDFSLFGNHRKSSYGKNIYALQHMRSGPCPLINYPFIRSQPFRPAKFKIIPSSTYGPSSWLPWDVEIVDPLKVVSYGESCHSLVRMQKSKANLVIFARLCPQSLEKPGIFEFSPTGFGLPGYRFSLMVLTRKSQKGLATRALDWKLAHSSERFVLGPLQRFRYFWLLCLITRRFLLIKSGYTQRKSNV